MLNVSVSDVFLIGHKVKKDSEQRERRRERGETGQRDRVSNDNEIERQRDA